MLRFAEFFKLGWVLSPVTKFALVRTCGCIRQVTIAEDGILSVARRTYHVNIGVRGIVIRTHRAVREREGNWTAERLRFVACRARQRVTGITCVHNDCGIVYCAHAGVRSVHCSGIARTRSTRGSDGAFEALVLSVAPGIARVARAAVRSRCRV
jgi:hypothetical protein